MEKELEMADLGAPEPSSRGSTSASNDVLVDSVVQTSDGEVVRMRDFMGRFRMYVDGKPCASTGWGTLVFKGDVKEKRVPYLCLSTEDSAEDARDFVLNMMDQKYGVGYEQPSLILSITGGAKSFALNHHLLSAISKGLKQVVERTHAWVVSGGTNTGVMKLTGQIMEKIGEQGIEPPVIGVATCSVIVEHEKLKKGPAPKLCLEYDANAKTGFCGLDENHNLFMLVDDGSVGKFGVEIAFRAKLEAAVSSHFDAPVVTIVIQGGPGTLDTALNAVREGTPCVIVDGSGLAADVLAYAYNFLHSPLPKYASYSLSGLKQLISKLFGDDKLDSIYQKTLQCVNDEQLIVVYNLQDQGSNHLDNCILEAIFGTHTSLKNKLKQAMFFGNLDVARTALEMHDQSDVAESINDNLMSALIHNMPQFVELYLSHGAQMHQLKPTAQFYKDVINPYNAMRNRKLSESKNHAPIRDMGDLPDFVLAIEQLYHAEASKSHSFVGTLALLRANGKSHRYQKSDILKLRKVSVAEMEGALSSLVSAKFQIKRDFSEDDSVKNEITASHMLFMWAICLDKFRMAKMFWERGNESIINALVGSRILSRLARHAALQGPHLIEERKKMLHNSEKFEQLAVGVLNECYESDSDLTALMLHEIPTNFHSDAITVSYQADSLAFLSHRATQAVLNEDWYGQMSILTKWYTVAVLYFLPIFVPIFISRRSKKTYATEDVDIVEFFGKTAKRKRKPKTIRWVGRQWNELTAFYDAPFTRFVADLYGHLALCLLFSYYVIDEIDDTVQPIEIVIAAWFAVLAIEELRQVRNEGRAYFADLWNRFDIVILSLYFIGFGIRASAPDSSYYQVTSKAVHSITTIVLWLRCSRYYAVSEVLGPKLIMMASMFRKDVMAFVMLLLIFLIGFGVASQSLLYPDTPLDEHTLSGIFFRPYYQIYGEFFLEDINDESGCIGSLPFSSCGAAKLSFLLPYLLGLYILVTNILLVNLLIAMFNDTYSTIQDSAESLWRKQNFELLLEYRDRPALPAPLIIVGHIKLFISWVLSLCASKVEPMSAKESRDRRRKLHIFQEAATERYLREEVKGEEQLVSLVEQNGQQIAEVSRIAYSLQESVTTFRQSSERHLAPLSIVHTQVQEMGRTLNKLAQALGHESVLTSSALTGMMYTPSADEELLFMPPRIYPGSSVERFTFPARFISWSVSYADYKPVDYTHPSVASEPVWADRKDPTGIQFNTRTLGKNGKAVDRTTCHPSGKYRVASGNVPVNPFGRTGMVGRGLLGKWGVNQAADTVVTRWKRARDNTVLERDGRKVLEFIAIQREDNGMWAIPGGFVDDGESRAKTTSREFMEEAMKIGTNEEYNKLTQTERDAIDRVFAEGKIVARIYSEDPRNTDNAWIETTCINFHDETGHKVKNFTLQGGDDAVDARWTMVHGNLNLFASHRKLLSIIARYHNAYF